MGSILSIIEKYWRTKVVGFVVLPFSVIVFSISLIGAVAPSSYFNKVCITAIFLGLISILIWIACNRIQRHRKGTIGFDLVLEHESEEQGRRIRADFCSHLKSLLTSSSSTSNFSYLEHPQWVCKKFADLAMVRKLSEVTKSCFMLYGHTKLRMIDGKEQHVLELGGSVRHAPIKEEISKKIANEMRLAFGHSMVIAQENDIFTFKITASKIEIATKYIVSIAAIVSKDLEYAETLLTELHSRLIGSDVGADSELAKIKNRVPIRLGEIGVIRCQDLANRYIFGEDRTVLGQLEENLEKYKEYHKGWCSSYLLRAICKFETHRDIQSAKDLLQECSIFPDTTWHYSMAFLHAYEGNMQGAWSCYQKAFNKPSIDLSVPNQSESFIHKVISLEPDKSQLWYCLGLINYKAKEDFAGAKRDFAAFLSKTNEGEFEPQRKLATRYINKIDSLLKELSGKTLQSQDSISG